MYMIHVVKAIPNLTNFIKLLGLVGENRMICLTCFDELHKLGSCYWILMWVLNMQAAKIPMWYVFMGIQTGY